MPTSPHRYPLSDNNLGTNRVAASFGNAAFPFLVLRKKLGYMPVRKLARLGVQMGLWQYVLVKLVLSLTKPSKRGVFIYLLPNALMVSKRC